MTRTVLITGTSSDLGRASARLFQVRGWNIVAKLTGPSERPIVGLSCCSGSQLGMSAYAENGHS